MASLVASHGFIINQYHSPVYLAPSNLMMGINNNGRVKFPWKVIPLVSFVAITRLRFFGEVDHSAAHVAVHPSNKLPSARKRTSLLRSTSSLPSSSSFVKSVVSTEDLPKLGRVMDLAQLMDARTKSSIHAQIEVHDHKAL